MIFEKNTGPLYVTGSCWPKPKFQLESAWKAWVTLYLAFLLIIFLCFWWVGYFVWCFCPFFPVNMFWGSVLFAGKIYLVPTNAASSKIKLHKMSTHSQDAPWCGYGLTLVSVAHSSNANVFCGTILKLISNLHLCFLSCLLSCIVNPQISEILKSQGSINP